MRTGTHSRWSAPRTCVRPRVPYRKRGGRSRRLDARIRTRPERPRAQADARAANGGRTCPFVHTGRPRVCEVGHAEADSGGYASVCAHGAYWRVRGRTRDRQNGAALVRLCTRGAHACAKSDTKPAEWHRSCPFVHTTECPVCTSGHDDGRGAWRSPHARGANDRRARAAGRNDLFKLIRAARAAASLRD